MANTDSPSADSPTDRTDVSSLTFKVEALTESHVPLVARFSERYWSRPRTEAYYRWRYIESLALSATFVAVTDAECLGLISALKKQFLIGGVATPCLEIFDWHSLPGLKGSGVGIRVMRALMRQGVRLLGIGGTADVLKALPAMGWQTIGEAMSFELPIAGESLEKGLRARVPMRIPGERFALEALTGWWFQPRARTFNGDAIQVARIGNETDTLYAGDTGYEIVQVPSLDVLDWTTTRYPGAGGYAKWYFTVGDRLAGWAMSRVYETDAGREAALVDIFAPSPSIELYAWMVSEVAAAIAGARPRVIRARASCPTLQAALRLNRFRQGDSVPVHTWPKMPEAPRRIHFTLNHGDAPFRPSPAPGAATRFLAS